jgi:hypothetical protein
VSEATCDIQIRTATNQEVPMYHYDPTVEKVAKAIAKSQGWDITYSVLTQPNNRAAEFWRMAVAAIEAMTAADSESTSHSEKES